MLKAKKNISVRRLVPVLILQMGGVLQMTTLKILALTFIASSVLFLPSCVAGGSGVNLAAKKNFQDDKRVDLKIRYYAYGGASLKKLKTCLVRYDSGSSASSVKVVAVESSRERKMVEWTLNGIRISNASNAGVQVEIFTEVFKRPNTITSWIVSHNKLTSKFQPMKSHIARHTE